MLRDEIKQHLSRVCAILNSHHVEYMVVGGAAVSHYGFSRPSGIGGFTTDPKPDLDFWYKPTIENFESLIRALNELQIDVTDLKKIVFDKNHTFLKIPHENFHTDFLPVMAGLDSFRDSIKKADSTTIEKVTIKIISYDDLLANKRAVNRNIDQSDINELQRFRSKKRRGKRM